MAFCDFFDDLLRADTLLAFVVAAVLHAAHASIGDGLGFAALFVLVFLALKTVLLP